MHARKSRSDWVTLVRAFERSEETHEAFCRERGVKVGSFRAWLYKLRREGGTPDIRMVPVDVVPALPAENRTTDKIGSLPRAEGRAEASGVSLADYFRLLRAVSVSTGEESFDITGIPTAIATKSRGLVNAARPNGKHFSFEVIVRIDTPQEAEYYRNGGILPYVLRQLVAGSASAA